MRFDTLTVDGQMVVRRCLEPTMNLIAPLQPVAFSISDAASYSGLSRSRLYTLMQAGDLPSLLVGGRRLIRREALDAFFASLDKVA